MRQSTIQKPPTVIAQTIYFPRRGEAQPDPVPHVLTNADVFRLMQLDKENIEDVDRSIGHYRNEHGLKGARFGREFRYLLPDVLEFLERLRELKR
jgi:hypothetical protein